MKMSRSVGIDSVIKYLKSEQNRFKKAADSGMFCDSQSCYDTAHIIDKAIYNILKNREEFNR